MAIRTYDPAKHLISFAGNLLGSPGKDTFIKASRNEDGFMLQKGVAGEGTRTRNNNKSGTVEYTCLASSQTNDILSAIAAADELAGTGVGTLFMKESNGTSVLHALNAWIKKLPDTERAKEAGEVTWLFECDSLEIFQGGIVL